MSHPLSGLKVAYIAFESFPNSKGSGTRIRELTHGLMQAGAEVNLLTLPSKSATPLKYPVTRHYTSPILDDNFLSRSLKFRNWVARTLMGIRPDIIHYRGIFEGQAALSYAAQYRCHTLFEVNGVPSIELPYHYPALHQNHSMMGRFRSLEQRNLQHATWLLTQSQTTQRFLQSRAEATSPRTTVIRNAADPKLFFPSTEPQTTNEPIRILYSGTMAPWQGTSELLMAMRRCLREQELHLVLAGPARRNWQTQIERFVQRLKIDHAVELLGAISKDELAEQMQQAAICVAPLRRDLRNKTQGCNPIKLYEYMAAGKAILATDLPCVQEILTHNQTGWLAWSPRPAHMAEQLLHLARSPELREQLGQQARKTVMESATWDHRRQELLATYQQVLAQPPGERAGTGSHNAGSLG
jgi:glycosyltransferase involved in cell wall biosynthesis